MKFSGAITNDKNYVYTERSKSELKDQCHRGQNKFCSDFSFPDDNSKENDKGALLVFEVICHILSSHRLKNLRFGSNLRVSGR